MTSAHYAVPQPGADSAGALHLIEQSGLFDVEYYLTCNPDMAAMRPKAMAHYHAHGWREGRKPNLYFDPGWYLLQQPDVARDGVDPLLHYLLRGEAEGCRPSAWFDPAWYRTTYTVPDGMHALRHYLLNRGSGTHSAMAEFDSPFYFQDIVSARSRMFHDLWQNQYPSRFSVSWRVRKIPHSARLPVYANVY